MSQPAQGRGCAEAFGVGKDMTQHEASQSTQGVPLAVLLRVRPERVEQLPVLNSRGAGGDARQAAETLVHIRDSLFQTQIPFQHLLHQDNAAPWGIHLLAQHLVGRAYGKAEPTVDAGLHFVGHGLAVGCKIRPGDFVSHLEIRESALGIQSPFHFLPQ